MGRTKDEILGREIDAAERLQEVPDQLDAALDHLGEIADTLSDVLTKFQPASINRIFLSHSSSDKELVREYHSALRAAGLDPWLDEDDLTAGNRLESGLVSGLKDSCAVVFFVTPNFKDERYTQTEIDHSLRELKERPGTFTIITLLLNGATSAQIPALLKTYVWKTPSTNLRGFIEIVRALPIRPGTPVPR